MRKNKKCEKVQKWETTADPPREDEGVSSKEPTRDIFYYSVTMLRRNVLCSFLYGIQRLTTKRKKEAQLWGELLGSFGCPKIVFLGRVSFCFLMDLLKTSKQY